MLLRDEYFHELPWVHIGEGSNLLFLDDYPGLILRSKMTELRLVSEDEIGVIVEVDSGMVWDELVAHAVDRGWYGIENLSYIPGSVGGAAVQNVGAYGVEVGGLIEAVHVIDSQTGEERWVDAEACGYSYRMSYFKKPESAHLIVLAVRLRLSKREAFKLDYGAIREMLGDQAPTLPRLREVIIAIRQSKLPEPAEVGSAGSFFKNPVVPHEVYERLIKESPGMPSYAALAAGRKLSAAWLIDQCGWKGVREGAVGTWHLQPLVVVHYGSATGDQIASFAAKIVASVQARFGVTLEPEVRYI